ncbi:hypothetical protein HX021_08075 [Sphingobacterium sp. N143]|uniref:hypothetical protein n=1 Tax=Sphingobacterium sp. N143 TaxID=2746727 RepID=UPI002576EDFE|nr:hypothetical protein [Sphingobacterium sp. N143]MDM1294254.1 hypothetical protein [Sphingobacterium sp. N143]
MAQEYVRLDKNSFQLHLSESPKDTIRIIENGKTTKLKTGKYILQQNQFMGPSNAFVSINQEGLVEGNFKIEKDGKRGIVEVRHGVMQQMNVKTDEVLNFQYVITDTSSVQRDFRNGKISQEKLVFYQPKKGKRKVSKIFFDDHYTVENEFDHTKSDYGLDNKLISRAKLDCSGQVLESRSFDKNGQLVKHIYKKDKINYTDLYQHNNLAERIYSANALIYHEYFKNQLLVKKIVEKKNKGQVEIYVYNGEGKLLEKKTASGANVSST